MTVETRKLEWLMVNQDESAVLGRQQRLESCLGEGCHIHPRSPCSSKSIRKASIEKHNLFGRWRLLQERPRDEAGDIQCCQEMLADSPTNLQIGLTSDIPCAAKIRGPQWRVPQKCKAHLSCSRARTRSTREFRLRSERDGRQTEAGDPIS